MELIFSVRHLILLILDHVFPADSPCESYRISVAIYQITFTVSQTNNIDSCQIIFERYDVKIIMFLGYSICCVFQSAW